MSKMVPLFHGEEAFDLLDQLEQILDHDHLIDEVGFIHPSQLSMLNEEADSSSHSPERQEAHALRSAEKFGADEVEGKNAFLWNRDHKLGISTECLLPLYKAAKAKFMEAFSTCKLHYVSYLKDDNVPKSFDLLEIGHEVMKHSKPLLLLSSDFGTAWNARKLIISKREDFSISEELVFSALVLSFAPKSESAWSYRRWLIKLVSDRCASLEEILENESKLVEKIAEKSKMNYRAWNHRCWLISYMTSQQVVHELNTNRNWAVLHVADSSCFHYRRKLMLRMLDDVSRYRDAVLGSSQFELLRQVWKDELDWNEVLIRRYIGREALWLHRRLVSICWVKNFLADQQGTSDSPHGFMNNELCLLQDCLSIPDSEFTDVQSQAIHSASYILWLYRENVQLSKTDIGQPLGAGDLMTLLNKLCPEKTNVWGSLLSNLMLPETT